MPPTRDATIGHPVVMASIAVQGRFSYREQTTVTIALRRKSARMDGG